MAIIELATLKPSSGSVRAPAPRSPPPRRWLKPIVAGVSTFGVGVLVGQLWAWTGLGLTWTAAETGTSIIQSLFTSVAIIAGAAWFWFRREPFARADVSQEIVHHWLDEDTLWLRVVVRVENRGHRVIDVLTAEARILQVLPLAGEAGKRIAAGLPACPEDRSDVDWPELQTSPDSDPSFHVEPGESDSLTWDFVIPCGEEGERPELVVVYTHLSNSSRPGAVGWPAETVYDVRDNTGRQHSPNLRQEE